MNNIAFSKLNLKQSNSSKTIKINDFNIEVLQYLPVKEKDDIIYAVLAKSFRDGFYDDILIDMYFHLYLVYSYTNITFTAKQKEDEFKLYDLLNSNKVIEQVLKAIPEDEYTNLCDYMTNAVNNSFVYSNSIASVVNKFINDMPKNAEKAAKIVDNFDPEKYKQVVDLAKATGMRAK